MTKWEKSYDAPGPVQVSKAPWFDVVDADGEPMTCAQQGANVAAEVAANFGGYVIPAGLDAAQRKAAVAALIPAAIANATQHATTPEQIAAGVIDLPADVAAQIRADLTVDELPTRAGIAARCDRIAARVAAHIPARSRVMIGGAPWMMRALEDALRNAGLTPVYAFSVRESVEQQQPDGTVRKTNVFRHAGWVLA